MQAKMFEIRDKATFIPVLAVRLEPTNEQDRYLLARAGFGRSPMDQGKYVTLVRVAGGEGTSNCDPYGWRDRTMREAHNFIEANWPTLESGVVIDVEHILGETVKQKLSEAVEDVLSA